MIKKTGPLFYARFLALFLTVNLAVPPPLFAFKPQEAVEGTGLEELRTHFEQSAAPSSSAGLEEAGEVLERWEKQANPAEASGKSTAILLSPSQTKRFTSALLKLGRSKKPNSKLLNHRLYLVTKRNALAEYYQTFSTIEEAGKRLEGRPVQFISDVDEDKPSFAKPAALQLDPQMENPEQDLARVLYFMWKAAGRGRHMVSRRASDQAKTLAAHLLYPTLKGPATGSSRKPAASSTPVGLFARHRLERSSQVDPSHSSTGLEEKGKVFQNVDSFVQEYGNQIQTPERAAAIQKFEKRGAGRVRVLSDAYVPPVENAVAVYVRPADLREEGRWEKQVAGHLPREWEEPSGKNIAFFVYKYPEGGFLLPIPVVIRQEGAKLPNPPWPAAPILVFREVDEIRSYSPQELYRIAIDKNLAGQEIFGILVLSDGQMAVFTSA